MNLSKKNILIYEPYPFEKISGNLKTLIYIIRFLNSEKFNLILVVPFKTGFLNKLNQFDIEIIVLDTPKNLKLYGKKNLNSGGIEKLITTLSIFSYSIKLVKLIKQKKIDLIYCNGIRAVSILGLSAFLTRRPILWYVKGKLENIFLDTLAFFISKRILFYSKLNSKDKYPLLQLLFKNKISIVPTGLDIKEIDITKNKSSDKICSELKIYKKNLNIGFFGQLYEPKGVHYLIESVGKAIKKEENIVLYIVGDSIINEYSDYKHKLNSTIELYGINNKVFFTGWRNDALQIMNNMDIIVHPSMAEGFSRSVLEAMALSKVVIASGIGGERETIIDGENGYIINPFNTEEIAKKLIMLCRNYSLVKEIGNNALSTIKQKHLIEDKINKLGTIIEEEISKISNQI